MLVRNAAVQRAIDAIAEDACTPVKYPGAVADPETGAWISDAEVAEISYTMAETRGYLAVTARLIVRRGKDANQPDDGLFPIRQYHPFFTNSTETATAADITHRRHAIIETTFADLIDGPLVHIPSGHFGANSAWAVCAAIAHNLLRATATLARTRHRGRPRRQPAPTPDQHSGPTGPPPTPTDPAATTTLTLATSMDNPVAQHYWLQIDCLNQATTRPGNQDPDRKSWTDQQPCHAHHQHRIKINSSTRQHRVCRWNQV